MDWQKYYKERLVTAQEAILNVKPGDTVVTSHAASNPKALFNALYDNREAYAGDPVNTVHMIGWDVSKHVEPGAEKYFHHNSLYVGAPEREAVAAGRADYTPIYFSKIPSLFSEGYIKPDVALIEVSTPDKHGYCSFGVTVDYAMAGAKSAKLVIALINSTMPRTHGDCFIHVSDIDYFVETDEPICELPRPKITKVEEAIGEYCASMVEDGATLQLGIGALPDALLKFLGNKKDLGIHSEMFSDGVVDLIEAGVINNKLKTLHPGKSVATFLMGTRKLYDYVDDNPGVYMAPVNYTNDPYIIAKTVKWCR
jgi:4-hydroxybutyrate CoA-transferase